MQTNSFALAQRRHDRALPPCRGSSQERIEHIASSLLRRGADCDPTDTQNFAEAISEASDVDLQRVAAFINDGEAVVAANLMSLISMEYWIKQARHKAEQQAEEEWLSE